MGEMTARRPLSPPGPMTGGLLPAGPQPYTPSYGATVMGDVSRAYPGLAQYAPNTAIQWGKSSGPTDDRQLEYYPPWESDNPNPGKSTVELYNRNLTGQDLTDSVALDLLHHVGAVDPRSQQPVDPTYYALKQALVQQIKARNAPMDLEDYKDSAKYGPVGSYDDYLQNNRADAYIRALVSPRMNPEWQGPGILTPEMLDTGAKIRAHLAAKRP